jgi:hypothetical protein
MTTPNYHHRRHQVNMELGQVLTRSCIRLLEFSLKVSPRFLCFLVFMCHGLLSKFSILPLFPQTCHFIDQNENYVIFTCFVATMSIVWHSEWHWSLWTDTNDMFQRAKGVKPFYGKGSCPLLWAGLQFVCGKITRCASPTKLLWILLMGWKPVQWTKLHVKPATLVHYSCHEPTNCECSYCGCVITCTIQMCHGVACKSKKFPPVQSPPLSV